MHTNFFITLVFIALVISNLACNNKESALVAYPPVTSHTSNAVADEPSQPESVHTTSPMNEATGSVALTQDEIYWAFAENPQTFYNAWKTQYGEKPSNNPDALTNVPNAVEWHGESWGMTDDSPHLLAVHDMDEAQRASLSTIPNEPLIWTDGSQLVVGGYAPGTASQKLLCFYFDELPDD